jgi:ABC-type polysaccharide/polyol phosphate transport system ATPase subunit
MRSASSIVIDIAIYHLAGRECTALRRALADMRCTRNLNAIRETCTCVLWLDQGRGVADGDGETVLASYESTATIP